MRLQGKKSLAMFEEADWAVSQVELGIAPDSNWEASELESSLNPLMSHSCLTRCIVDLNHLALLFHLYT